MSVLDVVMREEHDRISRIIANIEKELQELPKGYISEKKRNGNIYYYLQHREDKKMKSKYIPKDDVESYRILIAHRKELEVDPREMNAEKRKLERVLR